MNFLQNKYSKLPKNSMEYLRLKKKIMEEKNRLNKSNNTFNAFYHPLKTKTISNNINTQNKKEVIVVKNDKSTEFNFENFKEPLISFIVPVYNIAPYISECLDSILNQTVKNIEIIVVNDGSTDGVEGILNEYDKKYRNIKIINIRHQGLSTSRNVGIENSHGLYLSFIDGDDTIKKETSEYLLNRCLKYNLDACFFDLQSFDCKTGEKLPAAYQISDHIQNYKIENVISPCDLDWSVIGNSMCTGIYKKETLLNNKLSFITSIEFAEDCVLKFEILSAFKKIMFVDKRFYLYRRNRPNSLCTSQSDNIYRIYSFFPELFNLYFKYIDDVKISSKILNVVLREITHYAIAYYNVDKVREWCNKNLLLIDPDALSKANISDSILNKLAKLVDIKKFNNIFDKITYYRKFTQKSYYIISGQLNSTECEQIDSWYFFDFLKKNHKDAIYVCWKNHKKYSYYKSIYGSSVIGLDGDGVKNYEFFSYKLFPYIIRAKYIVQENCALNSDILKYIYENKDLQYVFLQHGITVSDDIKLLNNINIYNSSSESDKEFIKQCIKHTQLTDKNFIVAGLPRLDYLVDESLNNKYAFIMFTWRYTLNSIDKIKNSDYLKNILNLLNKNNIDKLINNGITPILSIHHHILNNYNLKLNLDNRIKIAESTQISNYIKKSFVCITDFSSISFDFRFLNKPVIYWIPDFNSKTLGIYDLNKQKICIQRLSKFNDNVNTSNDVINKIIYYSKNPIISKDKIQLNNSCFKYKTNISQHLYEELEKLYNKNH